MENNLQLDIVIMAFMLFPVGESGNDRKYPSSVADLGSRWGIGSVKKIITFPNAFSKFWSGAAAVASATT